MFDTMYGKEGCWSKKFEKICSERSILLCRQEEIPILRDAVATGENPSSSGVIHDVPRDWAYERTLHQQGIGELRQL
jgi:hypothetical protein